MTLDKVWKIAMYTPIAKGSAMSQSTIDTFISFANSLEHGYLKAWKARSMLDTFNQIKSLQNDPDRVLKWVKNCLEMEGFSHSDCEKVANWLMNTRYIV
jgi:hypothetical protein